MKTDRISPDLIAFDKFNHFWNGAECVKSMCYYNLIAQMLNMDDNADKCFGKFILYFLYGRTIMKVRVFFYRRCFFIFSLLLSVTLQNSQFFVSFHFLLSWNSEMNKYFRSFSSRYFLLFIHLNMTNCVSGWEPN